MSKQDSPISLHAAHRSLTSFEDKLSALNYRLTYHITKGDGGGFDDPAVEALFRASYYLRRGAWSLYKRWCKKMGYSPNLPEKDPREDDLRQHMPKVTEVPVPLELMQEVRALLAQVDTREAYLAVRRLDAMGWFAEQST